MFACIMIEYYFLVVPALTYGFHGVDYEDAKKICLPVTVFFSVFICAVYTAFAAVRALPDHMPSGWNRGFSWLISILAAPLLFMVVFFWILILPVLWGASI